MTQNILVPIDGSDQSYGGVAYAFRSFPDASITTFHVVNVDREWETSGLGVVDSWEERGRKQGERYHDRAAELAAEYGRVLDTETAVGVPHKAILERVVGADVDHIVMGSHGRSPITRPFVGRVTEAVARRASVPVTVVPATVDELEDHDLPGRVLVPVDGSKGATSALEYAITQFPTGEFTVIHAIDLGIEYSEEDLRGTYLESRFDQFQDRADGILESAAERAEALGRDVDTDTTVGKPAASIVEYAVENGFDQVVMGSRGRSRIGRALLGSVAEAVVQRSTMPVTLVEGASVEE